MTGARTVSVPTLDHGPVTITCPAWCVEPHDTPEYRTDIGHTGPEHAYQFGADTLLLAMLTQSPFTATASRTIGLHVEQGEFAGTLDPTELCRLAAAYVAHAAHLRRLAVELSGLLAGGDR